MHIRQLAVIGAGQMGSGIAQVMAQEGKTVFLYDITEACVLKGIGRIEKNLTRDLAKGRKTKEKKKQYFPKFTR